MSLPARLCWRATRSRAGESGGGRSDDTLTLLP
jgi:hypothetical protein